MTYGVFFLVGHLIENWNQIQRELAGLYQLWQQVKFATPVSTTLQE